MSTREGMLIKIYSLMYIFTLAVIMVTGLKATRGPEFISTDTTLAYEPGNFNENSVIEDQTSGYSLGHSVGHGNITWQLEEEVTNRQIYYEGSSSHISDIPEGSAELNDTSALRHDYVTNTERMAADDAETDCTKHTFGPQNLSRNVTDIIQFQQDTWSENPRKFRYDNINITMPMGEHNRQDITSELSYKNLSNIILTQESEHLETATPVHEGIMLNRANTTQQIKAKRNKTFETFASSIDHGSNSTEDLSKLLSYEEGELEKAVEKAWNYTEHFLSSGDLEVGRESISLMQQYVERRRRWIRRAELIASANRNASDALLSHKLSLSVGFMRLNDAEDTLHKLQNIYRLATIVKTKEIKFRNYSETLNYSAELPVVLEAEECLNGLEISIRDLKDIWQEYGLADFFLFPWNRSLYLVSGRNYLTAVNKSIHETYLSAPKNRQLEDMFQYYIYPGFYIFILVIGAIGNGTLILMFAKYKDIRTAPNIMIFNLALMDIMNLLANAPLYYVSKYHSQWLYLEGYGCRVYATFRFLNHSVIEFSIVGMSAQRYCAAVTTLRNPISQWRVSERCRTVTFLLAVWLTSLVVSLPPSLVFDFPSGVCFPLATPQIKALNVFYFALYSVVVPATIGVFSVITARKLKQSVRYIPGERRYRSQEVSRYRSANVVTALAISYAITHIPRSIWFFLVSFFHLDRMEMKYICIDEVTNYLIFSNSCLNPLALYISSGRFRQLFKRHLFCVQRNERQCVPLERKVTASSSTRLVYLIESNVGEAVDHKNSLKGLNSFTKQNDDDVSINPSI